ncbi:MAG: hypothetical protein GXX96_09555 [Planctomycetaceae bacterium]|nr:hypothetical protein [Planctomycetaceae bacterium]
MGSSAKRLALFPLIGAFGFGTCALTVLIMARESVGSVFALKFLSGSIVAGVLLGGLAAIYVHCEQRERLKGISNAICFSFIPLVLVALCVGALAERPSPGDRAFLLSFTACAIGWWLVMLLAGIAQSRGSRWGGSVQSLLVTAPIAVGAVAVLYSAAASPPAPDSIWSRWNGVRLVGIVILFPVCSLGLFFSLLEPGLVIPLGALAAALMVGAALGELIMGYFGWPVAGAFAGGIVAVGTLFWRCPK